MEWHLSNNEHTYILRYYLPCLPQYDEDITNRRVDELVSYCKKHSIGAVMFYVDLNPYWYYMPDTMEHGKYVADVIKKASEALKAEGISFQINYQNLVGSWDGNCDHTNQLPWEYYVDEFGESSYGVACMLGEKFRHYAGEKLRVFAETKPDVIWIDDDLRYHNHRTGIHNFWNGKTSCEGLDFGCFCDTHIKGFNEKYNTNYAREELVADCLKNSTIRKMWQTFLGECYEDTAAWICDTIKAVSPETKIAIMTSVPDVHSAEGREWGKFLSALSGGEIPLIRAHIGPYSEGDPKDFAMTHSLLERLRINISSQYNSMVEYCPEIENTRFTRYSKSIAATKFQMGMSAFLGCRGTTLSIFDLEGCILHEEEEFGKMLADMKPFCDIMNNEKMYMYESDGITLLTSPDRTDLPVDKNCNRMSDILPKRYIDNIFAKAGIPISYCTPNQISHRNGFALDRDMVSILTDEEIKVVLSKNVFLSGGACDELIKRGFSGYIGVKSLKKNPSMVSSEIIQSETRSDGSTVIVPSRIPGNRWYEIESSDTEILSSFVIPNGNRYAGFVKYQNEYGGKIFMYAADEDFGDGFFSNYRIKLLREICSEISSEILIADFPSYGVSALRRSSDKTALFVANLSSDSVESLSINVPKGAKTCLAITSDGKKEILSIQNDEVVIRYGLNIYDFCVVLFC